MECVFGPVPSRRLGRSLGIDPAPPKTCNFSCLDALQADGRANIVARLGSYLWSASPEAYPIGDNEGAGTREVEP